MKALSVEKSFEYFLKHDFSNFKEDEWLAICGNQVIAHDNDLKQVIKKASEACKDHPLFTRVKKTAHYLHK